MRLSVKLVIGASAIGGAALGAWDYASPLWTVQGLQSAILARDATALNGYVDFEALRTNLKAQFAARLVANNLGAPTSTPEYAATRLQSVNAMVDGMISPQAIQVAMERAAQLPPDAGVRKSFDFSSIHRDGFNQFHVSLDPAVTIAIRFERRGFGWQVIDVKLPYDLNAAFGRGQQPE
ncbi:MAG: DUF2939 domain-containing protein [Sphingomonas sp.]|uniref:DUF2939 domain-containing protein n=1 Tax=Sphingomonas sp. TaxID=28214 RepID=UPI0025F23DBC|nr:DUF2939 domain-containing protein [Sphingomonas sp.]MBX3564332.1 DUF2939 domain-containing protein [Sphingomonas sp.]